MIPTPPPGYRLVAYHQRPGVPGDLICKYERIAKGEGQAPSPAPDPERKSTRGVARQASPTQRTLL